MIPAATATRHRRSILFLLGILAAGGIVAVSRVPVALFPHVDYPRIVVSLDAGDRPADQMLVAVTRPVEQAVRSVPGVRDIRSTTSRGAADLSINMEWGLNMAEALLQVEASINQVLPGLPPGISFRARRMDPTVFPVAAYSLTSNTLSQVKLRNIAQYQLLPLFSSIDGVASVSVLGGRTEEFQVDVDPAQLAAYGLTFDDVVHSLSAANVLQAVGRMEDKYKLFLILSDTRLHNLDEIRHTVLRSGDKGLVEMEDIATVKRSSVPQWIRVTADGREAVSVQIYQQYGANTVRIVRDIRDKLARFRHKLPADMHIANWYDQSELITASAASVRDAILIGVGLAALLLLLFLRSIKITLVAIIVVPVVFAATVVLIKALHMSFNIMTLGGMAAATGLIVDDAIVMIEHIVRRLRGSNLPRVERIETAAREFTAPLAGSSASTIIIFVPLAFISGVTGSFFKALSLTMACALVISFFVAWLAVPLLADHLLTRRDAEREDAGPLTHRIQTLYRQLMERLLGRRLAWLFVVVPLLAVGYVCYRNVGSGFMPSMDEGGFVLDYRAPAGTSLTETDRLLRQVGAILHATPEVRAYSRRTGTALGGYLTEANEGDFFVRLKPLPRRSIEEVMNEVRTRVERTVPGLEIEMAQLMQDLIGDLTAVPQPIEIKLFGDKPDELIETARKVAAAIGKVPGVVDVVSGVVLAGDALTITVDRTRSALEGMDPDTVTRQLNAMLGGIVTTQVQQDIRVIGIRVWLPQDKRAAIRQIGKLRLRAPDGHMVPLERIASIHTVTGQPQINEENLKRLVAVTGRITGRDLGSTIGDIKRTLQDGKLVPADMYYELGGLYAEQQAAFRDLMLVFASALALVFLLLLFIYEQFRVAISILVMPMLAAATVFIGLWLTGIELNISSMMGMTMVVGIVTEVAIFYFSEYQQLVEDGTAPGDALIAAGVNRMRPIAMTTLAAIFALLPLALALGQGSAMQQPLAVAIIAGLVVQLPLVLVVMPLLYRDLAGGLPAAARTAGGEGTG